MNELTNSLGQPISLALPDWTPPPNPPRECMEGHFCRLEPLQVDSHLDDLYQANTFDKDGRSWTYLAYGPFSDKNSYRDWMTRTCLSEDPLFFAIVDKSVGSACGVASYDRLTVKIEGCVVPHRLTQCPCFGPFGPSPNRCAVRGH